MKYFINKITLVIIGFCLCNISYAQQVLIPMVECTQNFTLSFQNGRQLLFECNETNTLLSTRIGALIFPNNISISLPQPKIYNSGYDLIWEDEFNSGILDGKKWKRDIGDHFGMQNNGNNGPNNLAYEAAIDERPHLFEISNGTLKLKMRYHEQMANTYDYHVNGCDTSIPVANCILSDGLPNYRRYKYETARLESIQNFKHGYFKSKIKIPSISGIWPAFWLFSPSGKTEIDIFEFTQVEDTVSNIECMATDFSVAGKRWIMTYHDWKYMFGIPGDDYSSGRLAIAQNFTFANTWFEYGVIWDEYRLIWTLDDAPVRAVYKYFYYDNGIYNPISNQMLLQFYLNYAPNKVYMNIGFPSDFSNIIYNIQIPNFGGRYEGENNDYTCSAIGAPLQTQMEVDWVRVYAPRSCSDTIVYRNNKQLPTVIAAQQIELGGGAQGQEVIVQNLKPGENDESFAQQVYAVSSTTISLKPGFKVERGATFSARIDNCNNANLPIVNSDGNNGNSSNDSPSNEEMTVTIQNILNYVDSVALAQGKVDLFIPVPHGKTFKAQPTELQTIVNNTTNTDKFLLFPNPNNGTFTIYVQTLNEQDQLQLSVMDVYGKQLLAQQINNSVNHQIDLSAYSKGIYYVNVTGTNGFREVKKVVVN